MERPWIFLQTGKVWHDPQKRRHFTARETEARERKGLARPHGHLIAAHQCPAQTGFTDKPQGKQLLNELDSVAQVAPRFFLARALLALWGHLHLLKMLLWLLHPGGTQYRHRLISYVLKSLVLGHLGGSVG